MEITEIIKNAFIFPSKNLETLSIYAILSLFTWAFAFEGVVSIFFGLFDIGNLILGIIYIAVAIILYLLTRRITLQCIKSGIELEEKLPDFKWWESFGSGFKKIIVSLFYIIIPFLIVIVVGLITNVYGNILNIGQNIVSDIPNIIMGNILIGDAVFNSLLPLFFSLAITISVGLIMSLVSTFFQNMSEAKLAHTGSLLQALNIFGAAKDIQLIGVRKLFLLALLIFVIVLGIEMVLMFVFDRFMVLSILTIVITPYIILFSGRALGLLYSDIV